MPFLLMAAFSLDTKKPTRAQDKMTLLLMALPAFFWVLALLADFIKLFTTSILLTRLVPSLYVLGLASMVFYFLIVIFVIR